MLTKAATVMTRLPEKAKLSRNSFIPFRSRAAGIVANGERGQDVRPGAEEVRSEEGRVYSPNWAMGSYAPTRVPTRTLIREGLLRAMPAQALLKTGIYGPDSPLTFRHA